MPKPQVKLDFVQITDHICIVGRTIEVHIVPVDIYLDSYLQTFPTGFLDL